MESNIEMYSEGQGQKKSLWAATCEIEKRDPLLEEYSESEAVIIGAGMAGVLTGCMLQEKGIDTVIVESCRIGGGVTGYTTAKITSQHNLIYDRLITDLGIKKARQYATANQNAIDGFRRFVRDKAIDCGLEDRPAYLYTLKAERIKDLENESESAKKLGIPNTLLKKPGSCGADGWGLPFSAEAALKFYDQAQFHPLKFLGPITNSLKIYENTKVIDVLPAESGTAPNKSGKSIVVTERGKIAARYVVFTCHYPFLILPGYYFARQYQDRAYILALSAASQVNGLYIGIDQPAWSFRNYEDLLLFAGGSHRTGQNEKGGNYQAMRDEAKKLFPEAKECYAWSTQDCMPLDGVPYIGQYAGDKPGWFVATGFQKWGMTSSMIAADIISSDILNKPYEIAKEGAEVFSPQRFTAPKSYNELWEDVKIIGSGLLREIFSIPEKEAAAVMPQHGGVVEYDGKKSSVFRDDNNTLHAVFSKCTHMGCQLAWNPEEKSWDCPCHGSRFNIGGHVVSGPAVKDLERVDKNAIK
ncbi:MAG TPA: FAD-dependent oxidoreductase [Bacillota bacterium]|jgi:glycine/D-amino acid oxidase-like deaminating enzyme/nitrite reductase/ring-hydroxylating ferredoxin subunit|nr:FAD-dependent oxidoreductase [Bacillota bacterium]